MFSDTEPAGAPGADNPDGEGAPDAPEEAPDVQVDGDVQGDVNTGDTAEGDAGDGGDTPSE